jgi:hypothetical protein
MGNNNDGNGATGDGVTRYDTTTTTMATGNDENDDGDGATGDGATGYGDDDDCDKQRRRQRRWRRRNGQ